MSATHCFPKYNPPKNKFLAIQSVRRVLQSISYECVHVHECMCVCLFSLFFLAIALELFTNDSTSCVCVRAVYVLMECGNLTLNYPIF